MAKKYGHWQLRYAIVECMEEFRDVVFELTEPLAIALEHQTHLE